VVVEDFGRHAKIESRGINAGSKYDMEDFRALIDNHTNTWRAASPLLRTTYDNDRMKIVQMYLH
jgi:hypothetical protein